MRITSLTGRGSAPIRRNGGWYDRIQPTDLLADRDGAAEGVRARDALAVTERRVQSLADAHDRLLHGQAVAAVNMSEYLGGVARDIVTTAGRSVELEIRVEAIPLYIDTAVPCGLIANELVSNSVYHAFPRGEL